MSGQKKILIVDDDLSLQEVYTEILSDVLEVVIASSTNEALEHLEKDSTMDLILLDLTLPGMPIQAFMEKLRSTEATAALPVVLNSGREDIQELQASLGAQYSIPKPCELDQFVQKLEEILEIKIF